MVGTHGIRERKQVLIDTHKNKEKEQVLIDTHKNREENEIGIKEHSVLPMGLFLVLFNAFYCAPLIINNYVY